MSADTVLVTGALGQVGKRCTEILLSRGRTVVALDLRTDKTVATAADLAGQHHPGSLVPAYVDVLDVAAVRKLLVEHQPVAIVHLAAILAPVSYHSPRQARTVNVGGTRNLVEAAAMLAEPPLFLLASSAAVFGSVNPYRHPERITPDTGTKPIDEYGEDKLLAETLIRDSGLPNAALRLGAVISPDGMSSMDSSHLVLMRATPADNRMHAVDSRDVGLAFANAVDRRAEIDGKVLLIGGNETCLRLHSEIQDDMMQAMGIGRVGPSINLPGDRDDDRGWAFTGWFDTTESHALLDFQHHDWSETLAWMTESNARMRPLMRALGLAIRPAMRTALAVQRRLEKRGRYADPWALIGKKYGPDVLVPTDY